MAKPKKLNAANVAGVLLLVFALGWWTVAHFVFAVRHPWATSTERLVHIVDVLLFRGVTYDELRPRSGKDAS